MQEFRGKHRRNGCCDDASRSKETPETFAHASSSRNRRTKRKPTTVERRQSVFQQRNSAPTEIQELTDLDTSRQHNKQSRNQQIA